MPYTICVNMPGCLPEGDPRAVATLDEARDSARECVVEPDTWAENDAIAGAIDALPANGGVIQLPDGYVIDITRVSWHELARLADIGHGYTNDEILDAYNGAS